MNCNTCGSENQEDAIFCSTCGRVIEKIKYQEPMDPSTPAPKKMELGRGKLILTFGILSLVLLGPILGIPAWIMAHRDMKKIRAGIIAPSQKTTTNSGMILGIIGTFISPGIIIFGIAVAVGISLFGKNAIPANRDALIADMTVIATHAQEFYHTPVSMGGGGGAFDNSYGAITRFHLTPAESSNRNGNYSVTVSERKMYITGVGKVISDDGTGQPVRVTMIVEPESIIETKVVH